MGAQPLQLPALFFRRQRPGVQSGGSIEIFQAEILRNEAFLDFPVQVIVRNNLRCSRLSAAVIVPDFVIRLLRARGSMSESSYELLKREFTFYRAHQGEMVEKYDGRVIVLKNNQVIGDYATVPEAVSATKKMHPLGTFLVQRVSEGNKDYTRTFYSRVRAP